PHRIRVERAQLTLAGEAPQPTRHFNPIAERQGREPFISQVDLQSGAAVLDIHGILPEGTGRGADLSPNRDRPSEWEPAGLGQRGEGVRGGSRCGPAVRGWGRRALPTPLFVTVVGIVPVAPRSWAARRGLGSHDPAAVRSPAHAAIVAGEPRPVDFVDYLAVRSNEAGAVTNLVEGHPALRLENHQIAPRREHCPEREGIGW